MTICIAAIASDGDYVLSTTDTLISAGNTTFNPANLKMVFLNNGWQLLFSGTLSVMSDLKDKFYSNLLSETDAEPQTIKRCLQNAIQSELANYSANRLLLPYGIDMNTFMTEKERFTEHRWDEISRQIIDYADTYDPKLILCGWGEYGKATGMPSLFSADRDGVQNHNKTGFCVAGTGGPAAQAALSFYHYTKQYSLADAIYCVAAAGFSSERSAGVGRIRAIYIAAKGGMKESFFIQTDQLGKIRSLWESKNPQHPPADATMCVREILNNRQPAMESL